MAEVIYHHGVRPDKKLNMIELCIGIQNRKLDGHIFTDENGEVFHVVETLMDNELQSDDLTLLETAASESGVESPVYSGKIGIGKASDIVNQFVLEHCQGATDGRS